jgi:hypothetical protein
MPPVLIGAGYSAACISILTSGGREFDRGRTRILRYG